MIAEVQVIGVGQILVDALLHEAQAQHADVEIDVLLDVAGDAGHVVNARNAGRQASDLSDWWLWAKPMLVPVSGPGGALTSPPPRGPRSRSPADRTAPPGDGPQVRSPVP